MSLPFSGITGTAVALVANSAAPKAIVTSSDNANVLSANVHRRTLTKGWRLSLKIQRLDLMQPAEWRAFLQHDCDVLTETRTQALPLQ